MPVLFLSALAAGCLESDQQTTVYADGSGKVVWTIGVQVEKEGEDPIQQEKPDEMGKDTEGIVAWAEPKVEKKAAGK